jgi:hypothetical protein
MADTDPLKATVTVPDPEPVTDPNHSSTRALVSASVKPASVDQEPTKPPVTELTVIEAELTRMASTSTLPVVGVVGVSETTPVPRV